jgi:Signal transduction histidine kinase, nitrogen specific
VHSVLDLNLWADMDEHNKFVREITEKGFAYNYEIRSIKKSDEIFTALQSGVVITLNGERCVLIIKIDITELRQYQQEILRLDRLNLIGEMAAGIAHEVRNPMTTVKGFLQILGQRDRYQPDKQFFNLMIEEIDRANTIISEFLSLSKNRVVDFKMQSLHNTLDSLFPLIQADAMVSDKTIILELNEIPDLLLDEKEIRQLVLNLSRNALEAIPPGEFITIKTYLENDKVVLLVQDRGKGIPFEIFDKIGNPFFTTKENGTGLGLATCYSIAARHKASIDFDTGPEGTTFYVRFAMS